MPSTSFGTAGVGEDGFCNLRTSRNANERTMSAMGWMSGNHFLTVMIAAARVTFSNMCEYRWLLQRLGFKIVTYHDEWLGREVFSLPEPEVEGESTQIHVEC